MADALNRRDIDMIFRAETTGATRNVGELRKAVKDLRGDLDKQIDAAGRGEVSLDKLATTTRELRQAQDELGTARSLVTGLNTLTGQQEKAAARTAKLRGELTLLEEKQRSTGNTTKQLANQIANKTRAVAGAADKEAILTRELAEQREQIEGIIGPVGNFRDAFATIAKTSRDVSQGLALTGKAADDFKLKAGGAADAARELAQFNEAADAGKSAGLLQSQIAFLSQYENRVELLNQARQQLVAQNAEYDRALASQSATEGAARVRLLADAAEEAVQAQQRLEQTNAFQKSANDARVAFGDISRYRAETDDAASSMRLLATAVADLADPSRAASNDLSQLADKVGTIADRVAGGGKFRLGELSQDLNDLEQSLAGLQRQASQIDGLRAQQVAADAAGAEFAQTRAAVFELANAISAADTPTDAMAKSLSQAEAAADRAGLAFQKESTKLKQLEAAATAASIDIRNLDAAEEQIISTSTRAGAAATTLRNSLGTGRGGSRGFLGLKGYELQNLSFQVNDVVTGLISGQRPMQVFAQQGGQIAQIFPGLITKLAAALPILIPLGLAFGAVAAGMSRAASNAARLREVNAALVEIGESGEYTADSLIGSIDSLDKMGASAEDARKAVIAFAKEGLDTTLIDDFSTAALNLSQITGEELPDAAKRVTDAFTQGKDAVLELDNEFQFLSDSEREQIRAMDDSTDAAEIRTIAFDAFYNKAQEVAAELRGPSVVASGALSNAWSDLLDTLALTNSYDTILDYFYKIKLGIIQTINLISTAISRLKNSFGPLAIAYATGGFAGFAQALVKVGGAEAGGVTIFEEATAKSLKQLQDAAAASGRGRTGGGDPGRGTRGARNTREGIKPDKAKKASTAKTEAEKLAEQLLRETESLTNAIEQMTSQAIKLQQVSVDEQLDNAAKSIDSKYAKLYRQLEEFGKKFGAAAKIGNLTQGEFRAQLDLNKELLTQAAQLKVLEEAVNDSVSERTRLLKQIEEQQDAGLLTAEQAYKRALEVTSTLNPQVQQIAARARAFAVAIGGAAPSPELKDFLAKLDGIDLTLGETKIDLRNAALKNRNDLETEQNDILSRRDSLIAANNQLVELGLMTASQAREQAEAAYNREAAALRALIVEERAYLQVLLDNQVIGKTFFDARMAQLTALEQQTQYVDSRILQINAAAEGAFTAGFASMFDSLAQGLANIVTGGGDVVDLLQGLGNAALQFAADFLKAIADVIVQMLALQALKAILGASSGGIGGLFFHSGTGPGGAGSYAGGTRSRSSLSISPALVAAAPRYHNGTQGAGLKRNEMVAVLEKGEKVVTEEQQRLEAKRGQSGGGSGRGLKQVLAFGDDQIAGAMSGPAGEDVTITHIRRNRTRIRQELGIDG